MTTEIRPDFHLPSRIYIKQGIINEIRKIIPNFGSRVIVITTSKDLELYGSAVEVISRQLKDAGVGCIVYDGITVPPNTESIDTAAAYIKKTNCDLIIGFGSVDALNSAKALSILANNYIFCHDLLTNPKITERPLKFITIPACPSFGFEIAPLFTLKRYMT